MDAKTIAQRLSVDLYGKGQIDLIDELFTEDYVVHTPTLGYTPDRAGLRQSVLDMHANLSDITSKVTHVVVQGDLMVIRWTVSAIHSGSFFGAPPTGNRCTTSGINICRLKEGKIAEEWQESDNLGMLQQMGLIPTEEMAA